MKSIEIEARGREPQAIIDDMIKQLYQAGFHENGQVVLGKFEALVVKRQSDGMKCVIFRFLGKPDLILVGATDETFKAIDGIMSGKKRTIRHLQVNGKSPQQVMQAFVACLSEVKKTEGHPPESECVVTFLKVKDPSGKSVFAIEVEGVLMMILDDADETFMKQLMHSP